jgi:ethanolamine ammonia-lyase large subunit
MAGRSRRPGAERRTERTAVRWTPSEMRSIQDVKEELDLPYEVDVIRTLTLEGVGFRKELKDRNLTFEDVRKKLNVASTEDVVWTLALRQLDLISSALEKDVAE